MAIKLSNDTQCINYGNILQPIANMTVMCWFYATDLSTWKMLFGREDATGSQPGWHLEINNNQKGDFHGDHGPAMVDTTTTIALNTWYHMVGVRDATAGNQRIYLNGVLEATNTNIATIETVVNQMQLGETLGWPGEGFIGTMDDLRVYDRVLDADEIQTIYACKGSDTIVYGLQARWLFVGPEDGVIGGTKLINIENVQNASSTSSGSSLSFSYTVPSGDDLVLIVAATAEGNNSGYVLASNIAFNGNNMTNVNSRRTTASPYNGVSLWQKTVTAGESGNIVVTWSGNNDRKTAYAYVLTNAKAPEDVDAMSYSNTGETTSNLTTITDGSMVVTACASEDGYQMIAVGTSHVADSSVAAGAHAGAIGHSYVLSAGTISGIGFTSSPTANGQALVLAAFSPVTNSVTEELSNNEFVGTSVNSPTYQSTFLKFRRSLYTRI